MPDRLFSRFMALPRHIRWTIISLIASTIIALVFIRVVVGALNAYIEAQEPRGVDRVRLPYALEARPLPVYLDATTDEESPFLLLPAVIGEQYVLQIPLSAEEIQAANEAELEAFLALSLPAERALNTLQETLSEQVAAIPVVEEVDAEAAAIEATAAAEVVPPANAETAVAVEVVPTIVPTIEPVRLQLTAVDGVLVHLTPLNEVLEDDDSINRVFEQVGALQAALNELIVSGAMMPLEVESFKLRIEELAAMEPPAIYRINDCLVSSKVVERNQDETFTLPCIITQSALYVERGDYIRSDNGQAFNVIVTEFSQSEDATSFMRELFYHGRTVGSTGDFAIEDILEYNYFFSRAESLYTLAWSHENWVYSVTSDSAIEIDGLMRLFPY